MVLGSCH